MKRLWRITRFILRCPLTPFVLAGVLAWDAYALARSTYDSDNDYSAIGYKLQPFFGMQQYTRCGLGYCTAVINRNERDEWSLNFDQDPMEGNIDAQTYWGTVNFEYWEGNRGRVALTRTTRNAAISLTGIGSDRPAIADQLAADLIYHVQSHPTRFDLPDSYKLDLEQLKGRDTITSSYPSSEYRRLQLQSVRWPGYLHNTFAALALLALILSTPWSLCTIPGRIRRWRRKRRGHCIVCGYDIAGVPDTTICPECGNTIIPSDAGV